MEIEEYIESRLMLAGIDQAAAHRLISAAKEIGLLFDLHKIADEAGKPLKLPKFGNVNEAGSDVRNLKPKTESEMR